MKSVSRNWYVSCMFLDDCQAQSCMFFCFLDRLDRSIIDNRKGYFRG